MSGRPKPRAPSRKRRKKGEEENMVYYDRHSQLELTDEILDLTPDLGEEESLDQGEFKHDVNDGDQNVEHIEVIPEFEEVGTDSEELNMDSSDEEFVSTYSFLKKNRVPCSREDLLQQQCADCPYPLHTAVFNNSVLVTGHIYDKQYPLYLGFLQRCKSGLDRVSFFPIQPPDFILENIRSELRKKKGVKKAIINLDSFKYIIHKDGHVELDSDRLYSCVTEEYALKQLCYVILSVECAIFMNKELQGVVFGLFSKLAIIQKQKIGTSVDLSRQFTFLQRFVNTATFQDILSDVVDFKKVSLPDLLKSKNTNQHLNYEWINHQARLINACLQNICLDAQLHPEEKMVKIDLRDWKRMDQDFGSLVPNRTSLLKLTPSLKLRPSEKSQQSVVQKEHLETGHEFIPAEHESKEAEQKSIEAEQKSIEAEQKSIEAEKESINAEQKSIEAEQESINAKQKGIETDQKSIEAEQKRLEAEQENKKSEQENIEAEDDGMESEQDKKENHGVISNLNRHTPLYRREGFYFPISKGQLLNVKDSTDLNNRLNAVGIKDILFLSVTYCANGDELMVVSLAHQDRQLTISCGSSALALSSQQHLGDSAGSLQCSSTKEAMRILLDNLAECHCVVFISTVECSRFLSFLSNYSSLNNEFKSKVSYLSHLRLMVNKLKEGNAFLRLNTELELMISPRSAHHRNASDILQWFALLVKSFDFTFVDIFQDSESLWALQNICQPKCTEVSISSGSLILNSDTKFEISTTNRKVLLPPSSVVLDANFYKTLNLKGEGGEESYLMNIGLCYVDSDLNKVYKLFMPVNPTSVKTGKQLGYRIYEGHYFYHGIKCLSNKQALQKLLEVLNTFRHVFVKEPTVLKQLMEMCEKKFQNSTDIQKFLYQQFMHGRYFQSLSFLSRQYLDCPLKKLPLNRTTRSDQVAANTQFLISDLIHISAVLGEFSLPMYPVEVLHSVNLNSSSKDRHSFTDIKEEECHHVLLTIPPGLPRVKTFDICFQTAESGSGESKENASEHVPDESTEIPKATATLISQLTPKRKEERQRSKSGLVDLCDLPDLRRTADLPSLRVKEDPKRIDRPKEPPPAGPSAARLAKLGASGLEGVKMNIERLVSFSGGFTPSPKRTVKLKSILVKNGARVQDLSPSFTVDKSVEHNEADESSDLQSSKRKETCDSSDLPASKRKQGKRRRIYRTDIKPASVVDCLVGGAGSTGTVFQLEERANLQKLSRLDSSELQQGRLDSSALQQGRLGSSEQQQGRLDSSALKQGRLGSSEQQQGRLDSSELQQGRLDSSALQQSRLDSTELQQSRLDSTPIELKQSKLDSSELQQGRLDSSDLQQSRLDSSELQQNRLDTTELQQSRLDKLDRLFDEFNDEIM